MAKRCVNKKCNNKIYKDSIALCPECKNFLKKIQPENLCNHIDDSNSNFYSIEESRNYYNINEEMQEDKDNKKSNNKSNYIFIEGVVKKFYEQEIPTFL